MSIGRGEGWDYKVLVHLVGVGGFVRMVDGLDDSLGFEEAEAFDHVKDVVYSGRS